MFQDKPKVNGKVRSRVVQQDSPGLARSPAMHEGFRSEDWVVKRTPINTPDADRGIVTVGNIKTINLSDDEDDDYDEADDSLHIGQEDTAGESEQITEPPSPSRSGASSFAPSSVDFTTESGISTAASAQTVSSVHAVDDSHPEDIEDIPTKDEPKAGKPEILKPPAGFGDSPDKQQRFHHAEEQPVDEMLVAEEILSGHGSAEPIISFGPVLSDSHAESFGPVLSHAESFETPIDSMHECVHQRTRATTKTSVTSTPSSSRTRSAGRSRSRSSSKERLLATMADAGSAPVHMGAEEDEVQGERERQAEYIISAIYFQQPLSEMIMLTISYFRVFVFSPHEALCFHFLSDYCMARVPTVYNIISPDVPRSFQRPK